MELKAKFFEELTTRELFEILKARSIVFVLEQHCIYVDEDERDLESLHIFYEEEGEVKAYLRSFFISPGVVQVGRVLTVTHGTGLGGKLLKDGIRLIREKQDPDRIEMDAQSYAIGFYEREGFRVTSEEFLEEGIPHKRMVLDLR